MSFTVPPLPYDYNALEPHIDEQTMRVHHDKHHQAYVDKANAALEGTEWADKDVNEVLQNLIDVLVRPLRAFEGGVRLVDVCLVVLVVVDAHRLLVDVRLERVVLVGKIWDHEGHLPSLGSW